MTVRSSTSNIEKNVLVAVVLIALKIRSPFLLKTPNCYDFLQSLEPSTIQWLHRKKMVLQLLRVTNLHSYGAREDKDIQYNNRFTRIVSYLIRFLEKFLIQSDTNIFALSVKTNVIPFNHECLKRNFYISTKIEQIQF